MNDPELALAEWIGERECQLVEEADRLRSHHDDQLRLHDMDLPRQPRCRLLVVLGAELEAVRAVDRERIDGEPLQRLQERVARAAEERDAFGDLGRLRRVLEEEDVTERMPRAEHGHMRLVGKGEELVLAAH